MADRAQLTIWLGEAEQALHLLATGGSARVFVDQNGERIEYTAANRNLLALYINELKRQLGLVTVMGPLNPWF